MAKMKVETRMKTKVMVACSLLVFLLASCQSGYTRQDEILKKKAEQLTVEEMSRITAVVSTNYGRFRIQLHPEWAPQTCRNFIKLVQAGFYDGLTFHEVLPRIWIRGGDPKGDGTGGPGWTIPLETPSGSHKAGAVGMYHPNFLPNEAGSQFYIILEDITEMDGAFAVFGQVIEGMDTVQRIGHLPITPRDGKPRPFMPLSEVVIKDVVLEAKR